METPCNKVCVIDARSRLCRGCGRTPAEIAQWTTLSRAERLAIMETLKARMAEAGLARSD